ncbi:MAG: hypothetical protein ABIO39_08165 [Caulobacteraceae bacterium]
MADIVFTPRHHNGAVPHRRLVKRTAGTRLALIGVCTAFWVGVAFVVLQYAPPI